MSEAQREGALFGAAIGDALGVTYEFRPPEDIPSGRFAMVGGGPFGFDPGEASDDTDLLLTSLTAYSSRNDFNDQEAVSHMVSWLDQLPLDVGGQTARALLSWKSGKAPEVDEAAQGNGGLMRAAAHALACDSPKRAAAFAAMDTRLTHPSKVATDCSAFFAAMLWWVIRGFSSEQAAEKAAKHAPAVEAYTAATSSESGWCVHSLRLALFAVGTASSFEDGLQTVIRTGGDTDTNAAIAGAMLGARFGISSLPADWVGGLENRNRDRLWHQAARLWRPSWYAPDDVKKKALALEASRSGEHGEGLQLVAYYRERPCEPVASAEALAHQRVAVADWTEAHGGEILAEFFEGEIETASGVRPALIEALATCKARGGTLLVASVDPIGSGEPFEPRVTTVPVIIIPAPLPPLQNFIKVPAEAPCDVTLLCLPQIRTSQVGIYICNPTPLSIENVRVHAGNPNKLTERVGKLEPGTCRLVGQYDLMWDFWCTWYLVSLEVGGGRAEFSAFVDNRSTPTRWLKLSPVHPTPMPD